MREVKKVSDYQEAYKELIKQLNQATKQDLVNFALERLGCNLGDNQEVWDSTINVNIKIEK